MAAETYNIIIDGCWSDIYKGSVPKHSGVYFVYECTHNIEEKHCELRVFGFSDLSDKDYGSC